MNICFLSDEYNMGGGERNLVDLAEELKEKGYNILIVIPKTGQISEILINKKIRFFCLGSSRFRRRWLREIPLFIDWIKVYNLINDLKKRKFKPDIIHCNSINSIPVGFLLAKYYRVRIVWTCHGPWEISRSIKRFVLSKLLDTIITITPEIYSIFEYKNKALIPLGVNDIVKERKIKDNKENKKIICIGRFQKIKGQDILIRAYKYISQIIPDVELHFFGGNMTVNREDDRFYNDVREFALRNEMRKVFFHGFNAHVRDFMGDFDLLCIPSRYESFSIVLLEGLNRGMKIIAPNIGGPQYIIKNGENGILFEAGNINELADKCVKLLLEEIQLDRNKIIMSGREFTIEKQMNNLLKLYMD